MTITPEQFQQLIDVIKYLAVVINSGFTLFGFIALMFLFCKKMG